MNFNELCLINNGIATLRDSIFIHKNKLFEEPCWKKIYKVSKNKYNWIIFPYNNNKIIEESIFKKDNPNTYKYLEENKNELQLRDKGKKKYETWYAFGRKQSIDFINKNEKVLFVSTLSTNKIEYRLLNSSLFYSGLCITLKDKKNKIENIKKMLEKYNDYIYNICPKKSNGWISLTTSTFNNLQL